MDVLDCVTKVEIVNFSFMILMMVSASRNLPTTEAALLMNSLRVNTTCFIGIDLTTQEDFKMFLLKKNNNPRNLREKSRNLENPRSRNLENPKSRNLENPKSRNLENPKSRNLENPKSRNLENPNQMQHLKKKEKQL
jgi:hypothetical protein